MLTGPIFRVDWVCSAISPPRLPCSKVKRVPCT